MRKSYTAPSPHALPASRQPDLTDVLTRAVMDGPAAVAITDAKGTLEYVNRKFSALTGYSAAEAIGRKASLLKSGLMQPSCYRSLWRQLKKGEEWTGEFLNRKKNGEIYWEQASIAPVRDAAGRLRHYLKIAEDITERKRLESELRKSFESLQAHEAQLRTTCRELAATARALKASEREQQRLSQEDALTGLLNRRGFEAGLRRAKALAERQGRGIGFLIIDIDHFKLINDRHGHAAGDNILKACAKLFGARLRASDLLCRYGGDELVIALPSATPEATRLTAGRILQAVRRHAFLKGRTRIPVTVSIGASWGLPAPGQTIEHALRRADRALYCVKRDGRNGIAFGASDDEAPHPGPHRKAARAGAPDLSPRQAAANLLLAALDAREQVTGAHCRRVARMAEELAQGMGLSHEQTKQIAHGALLHDIGKITISEAILKKPDPLTTAEREHVNTHAACGAAILRADPETRSISEIVHSHHERLDGSGYPRGLKGKSISLGARVLAVADTYDAIRAGRPYAKRRSAREALEEIRSLRGSLFDPDVVDTLERCQSKLEAILRTVR